ncbi:hypothetical protein R1sor_006115 [Riccia sorocarpa]|uniref:Histone H2A n=1 Tax=Riccia sorocarpa TaxID=122646 RepID=A0ABD3HT06_9MARC
MTRPRAPRPKYPSDFKNYHEARRPGLPHTVRFPEELLEKYGQLKIALGLRKSYADVIRFLIEAAEPAIASILQERAGRVVLDRMEEEPPADVDMMGDPDGDIEDKLPLNGSGSDGSENDVAEEAGETAGDSEDEDPEFWKTPLAQKVLN